MKVIIKLILGNDYIKYLLEQHKDKFDITTQKPEDQIIYESNNLPIIICEEEKIFSEIAEKYFKDKMILLGDNPQNNHIYKISYPIKAIKLISLIKNLSEKRIFYINSQISLHEDQQILYNSLFDKTLKLNIVEMNFLILILSYPNNPHRKLILDLIWPNQDIKLEQKLKNFENLIYKLRKKLISFGISLEVRDDYYLIMNL